MLSLICGSWEEGNGSMGQKKRENKVIKVKGDNWRGRRYVCVGEEGMERGLERVIRRFGNMIKVYYINVQKYPNETFYFVQLIHSNKLIIFYTVYQMERISKKAKQNRTIDL
jgi:hypothetical protein